MGTLSSYLYRVYRASNDYNKDVILEMLDVPPGGRILDCGCGDGELTKRLGQRASAAELVGIEVAGIARRARHRGIRVVTSDLNRGLPFADRIFDVLHANQLIEHLHSTDRFLREARRVLKPDGIAILSTNNLASWHNIASLVLGMQPPPAHVSSEVIVGNVLDPKRGMEVEWTEASHLRIFTFQGLKEICEHHGFRVLELRTTGFYPLPPRLGRIFNRIDKRHGAFLIIKLAP